MKRSTLGNGCGCSRGFCFSYEPGLWNGFYGRKTDLHPVRWDPPFHSHKKKHAKLLEVTVQIEIGIQILAGVDTHFPEEGFTLLHGQTAAQGLV